MDGFELFFDPVQNLKEFDFGNGVVRPFGLFCTCSDCFPTLVDFGADPADEVMRRFVVAVGQDHVGFAYGAERVVDCNVITITGGCVSDFHPGRPIAPIEEMVCVISAANFVDLFPGDRLWQGCYLGQVVQESFLGLVVV